MRPATKWVVGAVIAVGLITAFLWFVPELQVRSFSENNNVEAKDVLAQTNEYRRTWAQIIAGFVVLLGLYFTWRRVEIAQEQQVTERFTRAIDQLGATDDKGRKILEIRLGGIYALERIARDSARDHWPIMETLTTYVREHAPLRPNNTQETGFILPPQTAQRQQAPQAPKKPDDGPDQETIPVPEPDIQAILTVVRRRTRYFGHGEVERLDLRETDLRRGNLQGAHLEGADLQGAHLEGADLRGAHLEEAYLSGAHLEGAILWEAHLEEASLQQAHLEGAILWEAHLEEAYLRGAHLEGAYLRGAHLEGAILWEAHLEEASLQQAHLEGAILSGAHLEGADLWGAKIEQAIGDEATKLPEGLTRPKSWAEGSSEQTEGDE